MRAFAQSSTSMEAYGDLRASGLLTRSRIAAYRVREPADLWRRVVKQPGDGCWAWTGPKVRGYGRVLFRGRRWGAHRVAWVFTHGEIPASPGYHGTCVLHRCDNPACVRPDHLRLGTNQENVADMVAKGRNARGSRHHAAKLTEAQVLEIRELRSQGLSGPKIAKRFGVSHVLVYLIEKRQAWRWS
jgi:hypothetical protein